MSLLIKAFIQLAKGSKEQILDPFLLDMLEKAVDQEDIVGGITEVLEYAEQYPTFYLGEFAKELLTTVRDTYVKTKASS
jgi:hypothetical protein